MNIFDEIKQKNPDLNNGKSWEWFVNNVRRIKSARALTPNAVVNSSQTKFTNQILPGRMYQYFYDPKYKDTLPYYDTFPLVIPFNADKTHVWALNLHYLPVKMRYTLLSKLLQFSNDPNRSENTKLNLSWKLINNFSKFPEVQPCVKCYLFSHIKSRILQVEPKDWEIAVFLPVEQFKKVENDYVWRKSREVMRR